MPLPISALPQHTPIPASPIAGANVIYSIYAVMFFRRGSLLGQAEGAASVRNVTKCHQGKQSSREATYSLGSAEQHHDLQGLNQNPLRDEDESLITISIPKGNIKTALTL